MIPVLILLCCVPFGLAVMYLTPNRALRGKLDFALPGSFRELTGAGGAA